jgi:hypothetical protein
MLEPMIFQSQGMQTNHYTTNAVANSFYTAITQLGLNIKIISTVWKWSQLYGIDKILCDNFCQRLLNVA